MFRIATFDPVELCSDGLRHRPGGRVSLRFLRRSSDLPAFRTKDFGLIDGGPPLIVDGAVLEGYRLVS